MADKKVVVLSGAGISAESGIKTFRDSGGLWEGYDVMEVATPQAWARNRNLVLDFYNQRRKQALSCSPNKGHEFVSQLEDHFDVTVITQNIDNLHEKAGSSRVIHLHGELFKARSTLDENLLYDIDGWELKLGDKCEKGSQLRPHVVWFGEMVPMMEVAVKYALEADILIVVGTSLVVYPAASIVDFVPLETSIYVVDPKMPEINPGKNIKMYEKTATEGMKLVYEDLLESFK
ncbi:NAD-dependent deacylase [Hyphobacterium sp. CCMP332]|nr:NAD-dependent deacylase [Hyphobacterium sp. CCMP332]